jgi:hypothetical protein
LNTRYYSHYNQKYGKKEERNENAEAVNTIEGYLNELKGRAKALCALKGKNYDDIIDDIRPKMERQALDEYEKFINDKNRHDSKVLIIDAYEGLLTEHRRNEKNLLNQKRSKEFERNRPPQDKWYTLKSTEFEKELYRNRMALKPNNQNRDYLNTL